METTNLAGNKFWGVAFGAAGGALAMPAAVANGAIQAARGSTFEAGFDTVMNPTIALLQRFGNDHSDTITRGLVAASTSYAAGRVLSGVEHVLRRR
jgi:hypothetical protein